MDAATALLLRARESGAEIRETRTHAPVTYEPRSDRDRRPWVVEEPALRQRFRLSGRECIAVADGRAIDPTDPNAGDLVLNFAARTDTERTES